MTSDSEWKARKSWMTEWLLPFPPIPTYPKNLRKKISTLFSCLISEDAVHLSLMLCFSLEC